MEPKSSATSDAGTREDQAAASPRQRSSKKEKQARPDGEQSPKNDEPNDEMKAFTHFLLGKDDLAPEEQ